MNPLRQERFLAAALSKFHSVFKVPLLAIQTCFHFPIMLTCSASLIAATRINPNLSPSLAAAALTTLCWLRLAPQRLESLDAEWRAKELSTELGLAMNNETRKLFKKPMDRQSSPMAMIQRILFNVQGMVALLCFYFLADETLRQAPNPVFSGFVSLFPEELSAEVRFFTACVICLHAIFVFREQNQKIRFRSNRFSSTGGVAEAYSMSSLQGSLELGLTLKKQPYNRIWTLLAQWRSNENVARRLMAAWLGLLDLILCTFIVFLCL